MKPVPRILLSLAVGLLIGWIVYLGTQRPKLSFNSEQFGLLLLNGGYRSWFLRFSDGHTFDDKGKLRSVVIEKGQMRFGYRIIPIYSHLDMRSFINSQQPH